MRQDHALPLNQEEHDLALMGKEGLAVRQRGPIQVRLCGLERGLSLQLLQGLFQFCLLAGYLLVEMDLLNHGGDLGAVGKIVLERMECIEHHVDSLK